MKNRGIFCLIVISLLSISIQQTSFAGAVTETDLWKELMAQQAAEQTIKHAFTQLLKEGKTSAEDTQNVKIIIEKIVFIMRYRCKEQIKAAEWEARVIASFEQAAGVQKSYFSQLVTGLKNLGSKLLAPFSYTDEEKLVAFYTAMTLEGHRDALMSYVKNKEYSYASASDSALKIAQLKKRYDAIIAQFDAAIYQQKLISGEVRSTAKKFLWGTAAVGAAAGLAAVASKYREDGQSETPGVQPQKE